MLQKDDPHMLISPTSSSNLRSPNMLASPNLGGMHARRLGIATEDFPGGGLAGQPFVVDGKGSHRTAFYVGVIDYLQRFV